MSSKEDTLTIHHLKCSPTELARLGSARSTVRRVDDRVFRRGDRIIFNEQLEATIAGVHRLAGELHLVGAHPERIEPHLVPMALIDFTVRQIQLPMVATDAGEVTDYRRILAIASSAGDDNRATALLEIQSIARQHLSSVRSSS